MPKKNKQTARGDGSGAGLGTTLKPPRMGTTNSGVTGAKRTAEVGNDLREIKRKKSPATAQDDNVRKKHASALILKPSMFLNLNNNSKFPVTLKRGVAITLGPGNIHSVDHGDRVKFVLTGLGPQSQQQLGVLVKTLVDHTSDADDSGVQTRTSLQGEAPGPQTTDDFDELVGAHHKGLVAVPKKNHDLRIYSAKGTDGQRELLPLGAERDVVIENLKNACEFLTVGTVLIQPHVNNWISSDKQQRTLFVGAWLYGIAIDSQVRRATPVAIRGQSSGSFAADAEDDEF